MANHTFFQPSKTETIKREIKKILFQNEPDAIEQAYLENAGHLDPEAYTPYPFKNNTEAQASYLAQLKVNTLHSEEDLAPSSMHHPHT